jgi:hypothetical protein
LTPTKKTVCSACLDAEVTLLAKMQAALQKNMGDFRKDMRDLVMDFFRNKTLQPNLNHVKWAVFQRAAGTYFMETDHPW